MKFLAVEDTVEYATSDLGRATLDYRARFDEESIERFRLGYVCIACFEVFESPFPEHCNVCGYGVRAFQAEDFAKKYRGVERDPRAKLIASELDRLDDTHERRFHETKSGIVVPATVKGTT